MKEQTFFTDRIIFYEELLGLRFKITPFSFFQTNSLGAEVLYETARSYIGDTKDKVIFDLYSGTGTIARSWLRWPQKSWAWKSWKKLWKRQRECGIKRS